MSFFNKFKARHDIAIVIMTVFFLILSIRMIKLSVVDGEEFREIAESRKFKEIPLTAPRGDIRDRNGELLATNKPSFTVQIVKEELLKDDTDKNEALLNLSNILNSEGIIYKDEFPLELNSYKYKNSSDYSGSPLEEIADRVISNNLLAEVLNLKIEVSKNSDFYLAKKALNILETDLGEKVPISVKTENGRELVYTEEDVTDWQEKNGLKTGISPKSAISNIIDNRNKKEFAMKLINDSLTRKAVYDLLKSKNLVSDIEIVEYSFIYDQEYKTIKNDLSGKFKSISLQTTAKEDFVNILRESNGISQLVKGVFASETDKENLIAPAEVLIDILKDKGIEVPFKFEIDENDKKLSLTVKNKKQKTDLYKKYNLNESVHPIIALIKIAEKEKVVTEFVTHEKVKQFSQNLVLNHVNPKISTADWEYSSIAEKKAWLKKYGIEENANAKEAFDYIVKTNDIDSKLSAYEARNIMIVLDEFKNKGYQSYYPINIAYGVNDKVISQLEENKSKLPGVKISIEPVRHYPNSITASHVLGYIGKISTIDEVNEYVKEKNYLPSTFIGKTGVEQSFEEHLKGKDGIEKIEVDSLGNVVKSLDRKEPIPGNTVYLTIDSKLQKVMEESLEKAVKNIQTGGVFESKWGNYNYKSAYRFATSASAVAIDPQTGEVLAMANYPSYDPNVFSTGITDEDWKNLMPEDESDPLAARPLYNTAIQTAVQPGSTFKMVTGMAAMEVGISPDFKIYDYGAVESGNRTFGCWIWNSGRGSHGPTDLYHALSQSCNYYFYAVSLGKIPQTGEKLAGTADVDEIMKVASEFGLNQKTGIEINGEVARGVPKASQKTDTTKILLKNYLSKEIDTYSSNGKELSKEKKNEIISEVVSWADFEEPLTKADIVQRLEKLGIDGEKKLKDKREDLSDTIKYTYLNQAQWNDADNMNISIGQGENSYTPIQMANYIATLANGGTRKDISVVDKVSDYKEKDIEIKSDKKEDIVNLKDMSSIDEVSKGMYIGATKGLVKGIFGNFPVKVAAKTGTAQRGGINPATGDNYDNYSWFTAFAPYEEKNPKASKIAVAVMISQGGEGGYAAPVGREIIAEYLKLGEDAKDD